VPLADLDQGTTTGVMRQFLNCPEFDISSMLTGSGQERRATG
jgi:hypothetical protein